MGPVVGVRYSLPEISPGSFILPQVIYLNSVASRNENKGGADINQLNIQPKFNVGLPDDWFLTAYASENIVINYGNQGKLFFPFDLMVGKKLFEKFVAPLEYSRELIHDKDFEPVAARRTYCILVLATQRIGLEWEEEVKYDQHSREYYPAAGGVDRRRARRVRGDEAGRDVDAGPRQ